VHEFTPRVVASKTLERRKSCLDFVNVTGSCQASFAPSKAFLVSIFTESVFVIITLAARLRGGRRIFDKQ